jgi:voltage-gated potassium channel
VPERPILRTALLLFAALLVVGTVGYMLTEGWSPGHALYTAVTTLATLGIERPTTPAGEAFTTVYVLVGVGTAFYVLGAVVVFVMEGQLGQTMRRRRMERAIERLRGHFIICGYGRVGREIVAEFEHEGVPFVLVDVNQRSLDEAAAKGHLVIMGSPASDEVLRRAGIETARGLIAATDNDAENIYVTLAARGLRPDLFIVARANHPDAESKLQRAGADRIISPYSVGGRRMAMLALRPHSVEFVDTVLYSTGMGDDLLLEDLQVAEGSPLAGLTVGEVRRRVPDVNVLAVKKGERMIVNPSAEIPLTGGDVLVAIGTATQLGALEQATSQ